MYTFPTAVINNVTYTARRWGQFPSIVYNISNAAVVAGSEIVVVATDLSSITIYIQDGASTNLQIKTAIAASLTTVNSLMASDLISVAITGGHNSDVNTTADEDMAGAVNVPPPSMFPLTETQFVTVDPVNPIEGPLWYNLTDHQWKYFDGTDVQVLAVEA
jgi:hypothetical protein